VVPSQKEQATPRASAQSLFDERRVLREGTPCCRDGGGGEAAGVAWCGICSGTPTEL